MKGDSLDRRKFLFVFASSLSMAAVNSPVIAFPTSAPGVQAVEDLMQEHGVLGRLLLIYEEGARKLLLDKPGEAMTSIAGATEILINHIQGQHERVEELMIFPVLNRANQLPELVSTLVSQHKAGRDITQDIQDLAAMRADKTETGRAQVARLANSYVRMFRPHALREDTVLYPKLRTMLSATEYGELSEKVKNLESKMKNNGDLSAILGKVDEIETAMGIHDLAKFTS